MADQNFVNFKRVRSLGDMLSDTIKFLSSEWQPFFITIVKVAIVPILIAIAAGIYFLMSTTSFYGDIFRVAEYEGDFSGVNFSQIFVPLLAFIGAYLVAYALVTVTSLAYIKSYVQNRGIVNFADLQNDTKTKFGPYVGLFFLVGIMVFVGMLFCFVPGIYLMVPLTLSLPILIFQNTGVFDAINDSFKLIKDHWWETFGILIVIYIITGLLNFIAELPVSIYQGFDLADALREQDVTEVLEVFKDPVYLLLVAIAYLIKFILYIITTIVTVFIYFDIREQKNPTSDDVIDEIGIS